MRHVELHRDGRVAIVSLSNPPYNLVTRPMTEELNAVIVQVERDDSIGAVILTSALEGIFLSHYDVQEILDFGMALKLKLPQPMIRFALATEYYLSFIPGLRNALKSTMLGGLGALNLYHSMARGIRNSSKVYIAAINGRALGGGCELALACDFRIMIDGPLEEGVSATGQPEIILGLLPGGGGTQMLSRMVGHARALEICLEGEPFNASKGVELGIVTKAVPSDAALREEAMALARRMANRSPTAIRAIKDCVHRGGSLPLEQGILLEAGAFAMTAGLPRTQAAMAQYCKIIDQVLGKGVTIDELRPWL